MKIAYVSTVEQEEEIAELIHKIYNELLPYYFSEEELLSFQEIGVLEMNSSYNSTLKNAFQIMTCLQIIVTLLETPKWSNKILFEHNVKLLNHAGLFFPFTYSNFVDIQANSLAFMKNAKPANYCLN